MKKHLFVKPKHFHYVVLRKPGQSSRTQEGLINVATELLIFWSNMWFLDNNLAVRHNKNRNSSHPIPALFLLRFHWRMNECMNEWMSGWISRCMDEWIHTLEYNDYPTYCACTCKRSIRYPGTTSEHDESHAECWVWWLLRLFFIIQVAWRCLFCQRAP